MMINKAFMEISFTLSDCPLATESPAWKCSCRVCIKPSNISMQHGIQVPENFCSVSLGGKTLCPTILLSQITNLEQGSLYYQPKQCTIVGEIPQNYYRFVLFDPPKLGNLMTPVEKNRHHEGRIQVARVASWPLDALQTRKNQSLASLQRPTHQHQSLAKFVACLRVNCSFVVFFDG